jgi:Ras-related protein Rab-1A
LVVYDVTSKETLEHVTEWMVSVNKWAGDGVVKVLVGNKADMQDSRQVSTAEAEETAKSLGMLYFETSAKTATNVDTVFLTEAQEMLKIGIEKEAKRVSIVKIQDHANQVTDPKKGCC